MPQFHDTPKRIPRAIVEGEKGLFAGLIKGEFELKACLAKDEKEFIPETRKMLTDRLAEFQTMIQKIIINRQFRGIRRKKIRNAN